MVSVAADLLIEVVGGVQAVAEDGIAVLGRDLVSPFGIYAPDTLDETLPNI